MTVSIAEKQEPLSKGVVPFVTEVARYFMDFLETDFHKVRNPKRHIQHRNSNNLQVTINLNKYKKYSALTWKVIRNGFEDDALNELKRGVHTTAIPQSLLQLIQDQINAIEPDAIEVVIKLFRHEIDLGISKNPNDTTAAITFALDGIARVIREKFLTSFIEKIKEPLDKIRTATVDSVYQVEEELTDVLIRPFEDVVSSIVSQISLGKEIVSEVEHDWDNTTPSEKLVYASPVPLNEEQRQILAALNKKNCKYITVEGPPGTGKSHTITAIACDAILKNQSILVLSDKKEALDVVEDKITETMNKVRLDNEFQNPILRLGQAGNTYSRILSTTSMERIKEHYKAVRNEYKKIETNIEQSVFSLKNQIGSTINAYEKIKLADIAEFTTLESKITADENLPVDLVELHGDQLSDDNLVGLRNDMQELKAKLDDPQSKLANLFKNYYPTDSSVTAFRHFITFLGIVDELRIKANEALSHVAHIRNLSADGLYSLESYITKCGQLKSGWFGYFLKGKQIAALNSELAAKLPNDFAEPHLQLEKLKDIIGLFRFCQQLKEAQEIASGFEFNQDFNKSIHQLLTLNLHLPTASERKELLDAISNIEAKLNQYAKTATKIGTTTGNIFNYIDNALTQYPDSEFEQLARYLCLKNDLQDYFNKIPEHNYKKKKKTIEELV
ncbi:MAG: hypothetical protein DI582_09470, partial [Azospirillum brasilense]